MILRRFKKYNLKTALMFLANLKICPDIKSAENLKIESQKKSNVVLQVSNA